MKTLYNEIHYGSICDKAYELIQLLNSIDDEEFIDNVIDCIRYNDEYGLGDLRNKY